MKYCTLEDTFELAKGYAESNPGKKFAVDRKGLMVGYFNDELRRYVPFVSATITGQFVQIPYEILINGELPKYEWEAL